MQNKQCVNPGPANRLELACLAGLVAIFVGFTWRGLTMFYSGDDMMNMYLAWILPVRNIWKSQFLPWMAVYRPAGTAVYRAFYALFGFDPLPLYAFCWLLLIGNLFIAWRFLRTLAFSPFVALLGLSLILIHGSFDSLYLSAGTIYDHLCFTFTALAALAYANARRPANSLSAGRVALICFLSLMAMNSKESGAAVPLILFCCECVYFLPDAWRENRVRDTLRSLGTLYLLLGAMLAAFWFGRVHRTPGLIDSSSYQPHIRLSIWLSHVAEYLEVLLYHSLHLTPVVTAAALIAMLILAAVLRNRPMLFGWLFFVLAITPVATIPMRGGFVLYVPELGLGLYFAALIGLAANPLLARTAKPANGSLTLPEVAILAIVTFLIVRVHATRWPAPWIVKDSPEWRLTDKLRRDYPTLKHGARILFVNDYFPLGSYDAMANVRLFYGDISINVYSPHGPREQQPDPAHPIDFDLVLNTTANSYIDLDNRNADESIKLNILRDHLPGRHFDTARRDRIAYYVSGILDSDKFDGGLWTTSSAKLKFDLYPVDSTLALKFWVPKAVASGKARTLTVTVDGNRVGTAPLTTEGMNELRFNVPGKAINPSGFTILGLDVDDPYREGAQDFGVVLLQAGFDFAGK